MTYKRTNHKNALLKLIREKGLILQTEAAKRLNRDSGSLKVTVESLVEEGKIKRQKIKQRFKNGNLNDCWLLYMPRTSQQLILNYEMELINKPFESPLKEHHCYKKIDDEVTSNITETIDNDSNVIDMQDYVKVNDYDLVVKEIENKRVLTFKEIDEVHSRPSGTARKRFNDNKKRFIEGEDYYVLKTDEANKLGIKAPRGLTLVTESGYLLLTKSFTDDLSWKIQRSLVSTYFKMKHLAEQNNNQPIPTGQMQPLDIMEMMIREMKKDRERIDNLENKLDNLVKVLSS